MKIIGKGGQPILSVDGWYAGAPPKGGAAHWVTGRSARELAVAWCGSDGPCVPDEVEQLLRSHPDFETLVIERALPEHQIRFDDLPGEPRNADLAIEARDGKGLVAITIEGKADESFDRPVTAVLQSAVKRIAADQKTGAVRRVESLSEALLPQWRSGLLHLGDLRYQLLTGFAGTLAWARELRATRAVFAIHEFVTDQTRDDKHAQNASDLNQFLERLTDGAIRNLAEERSLVRFAFLETRGYLLCRCILAKLCATRVLQDNPNPVCLESDSSRDMRRQLPFVNLEG